MAEDRIYCLDTGVDSRLHQFLWAAEFFVDLRSVQLYTSHRIVVGEPLVVFESIGCGFNH